MSDPLALAVAVATVENEEQLARSGSVGAVLLVVGAVFAVVALLGLRWGFRAAAGALLVGLICALMGAMVYFLRLCPAGLGKIFIVMGVAFDVLGCVGLVRLPDVYNRLQAATKCVTLGTCSILLGAALAAGGAMAAKAVLCLLFILVSSPVAAHALARGAHRSGIRLWEGSVGDDYLRDRQG